MGSSYYGEPYLGNERGSGSSRKSKKSNSERPKQPQRGLGVAQLEKIRLHGQLGCSYFPSLNGSCAANSNMINMHDDMQAAYASLPSRSSPSGSSSSYAYNQAMMMRVGEYNDSHPSGSASWNNSNESQHPAYTSPPIPREGQRSKSKKNRGDLSLDGNFDPDLTDAQELDLELRLSLS